MTIGTKYNNVVCCTCLGIGFDRNTVQCNVACGVHLIRRRHKCFVWVFEGIAAQSQTCQMCSLYLYRYLAETVDECAYQYHPVCCL
jgi:hypothetical protein